MDHVAILRRAKISKNDNLLGDILIGSKTIESRWYVNKIIPWNKIQKGESVYFKESGCPVTVSATVEGVLQFDSLTPDLIEKLIEKYGKRIAPNSNLAGFKMWGRKQVKKRYCILVFLKNVKKIESFNINKKGFGNSAAWLTVNDINEIRINK
ncbi:hypothetical protein C4561_02815 [candidate division WWE3 bacterium]|jgi:hypothetical protein|uniref:ASCH domain-containing protein n=1 Tax=candidate division WWE3 bacterium TaxID=2053526 RepID=A0A3A4ZKI3_UNCKA|nr:MAG: hypothetical protein C4561_02815 [candidate division WWE3 bacterium]